MPPDVPTPVLKALRRAAEALLPRGARVLVAVSGGPDSQALLDSLARLRPHLGLGALWAAGVDHQLRSGAQAELQLAEALARAYEVVYFGLRVTVPTGDNRLAAARRARYGALRHLGRTLGATHIALGHTATDQVETFLLNMCRGTSLRGAGGIRAQRGAIVRPLLTTPRADILTYLAQRQVAFAQDPSNADLRRARAQLRAHVLPVLGALNPRFERHIGAFCREAQAEDLWLGQKARRRLRTLVGQGYSLDALGAGALPAILRRRVVVMWLRHVGARPTRQALHQTLALMARPSTAGRAGISVTGADIVREHGRLWRLHGPPRRLCGGAPRASTAQTARTGGPAPTAARLPIALPCTDLGGRGRLIVTNHPVQASRANGAAGVFALPEQTCAADAQAVAFDADRLHFELSLRPWQQGDKVRPFGLKGRIKVGDLFTNHKVPRALRLGWPLLMCGDEVLWVIGLRRSAHAPVTAQTRRIVTLKVEAQRPEAQDGH